MLNFFNSLLVLRKSYSVSDQIDTEERKLEISKEAQKKIDVLINRGYNQIDDYIELLYDEGIYRMVYLTFYKPKGYIESVYEKDGISYLLKYAEENSNDPNLYSYVTFVDNDTRYRFIKINYFLEYYVEELWQYLDDDSLFQKKIFY
jgi:hypothetical protein